MKHIFRKNQMIVTALALMIAAAGYINYNNGALDDKLLMTQAEKEADFEATEETIKEEGILSDTEESYEDTGDASAGETVLTQSESTLVDKAAQLKLTREQTRAANKETLTNIVNNQALTETERKSAVDELAKLTDVAEREQACELLLETKGFEGAIVSITQEGADVVVNMAEISDANRAQIEDVVERKGGIVPEQIIISNMAD